MLCALTWSRALRQQACALAGGTASDLPVYCTQLGSHSQDVELGYIPSTRFSQLAGDGCPEAGIVTLAWWVLAQ